MGDRDRPAFPYRVKRLYLLQTQLLDESLKAHGLARSQWQVLSRLRRAGELAQRELQQTMQVEAATLTCIVDTLVSKGWLERRGDPADKRARLLRLTAEGAERLRDVPDPVADLEAVMFAGIEEEERRAAEDVLDRMTRNLEQRRKGHDKQHA